MSRTTAILIIVGLVAVGAMVLMQQPTVQQSSGKNLLGSVASIIALV